MILLLPRKSRQNLRACFFHVMVQGINKEFIFRKSEYKKKYISLLMEIKNSNIKIISFCIMDNHAHLLIHVKDIKKLSEFMWKTNFKFARYYNEKEKRVGVVFRNRYRLEEIYNQKYLLNCIMYIYNNPVKAGIVKQCKDYKYSNYIEFKAKNEYKFECTKEINENIYQKFIDIKGDEKSIEDAIFDFINIKNMKMEKILEHKESLKELVKYIKNRCNASNIEISRKLNISKTTVWNYLHKD